jgi:hypothetical protein
MNSSVGGELTGISLSSFLQMLEIEKYSCALKISSDQKTGRLFIQKGQLIAARAGDLKKEKAAYEIINWDHVKIEIEQGEKQIDKEMTASLMAILMEAMRLKDDISLKSQKDTIANEAITVEKAFEQIKGVDNKTVRQELDALNLPRSSRLRMALTRIIRDAFDADELAASIDRESSMIDGEEDFSLLTNLKDDNRVSFMGYAITLLWDHVNGKRK